MMAIKLIWDGSFLGSFRDNVIIGKYDRLYTLLLLRGEIICVRMKSVINVMPCIIDEIKPIFGLWKNGSHSIRIGGRLRVIYQPFLSGRDVTTPRSFFISMLEEKEMMMAVSSLLLFREAMSIRRTTISDIKIHDGRLVAMSDGCSSNIDSQRMCKSPHLLQSFVNIPDAAKILIGGRSLTENLVKIQIKIEKVILRINPKEISFAGATMMRLNRIFSLE